MFFIDNKDSVFCALWLVKTEKTFSNEVGTLPVWSNLCTLLIVVSTALWNKVAKTVWEAPVEEQLCSKTIYPAMRATHAHTVTHSHTSSHAHTHKIRECVLNLAAVQGLTRKRAQGWGRGWPTIFSRWRLSLTVNQQKCQDWQTCRKKQSTSQSVDQPVNADS